MNRRQGNRVAALRRGEAAQKYSSAERHRAMGRQRGVSIISAILLIVFLTAIGAFLVSVSQVQGVAAGLDVAGMRANHAALAGLEWGKYRVLIPAAAAEACAVRWWFLRSPSHSSL